MRPQWERWRAELPKLTELKIDRCVKPEKFGEVKKVELHHFADASFAGYGACTYIRMISSSRIHSVLLMGKSRVAPSKTITIPKLELQAAVMSSKIARVLSAELNHEHLSHHYWTDSKVVLGYINNESKRFHVYVANRVQQIRDTTNPKDWNYITTDENPADHASRGLYADELMSSNWFSGPQFLRERDLKPIKCEIQISSTDPNVRKAQGFVTKSTPQVSLIDRLQKFSSWPRVIRALTTLRKYLLRRKGIANVSDIEELNRTESMVLRWLQQRYLEKVYHIQNDTSEVQGRLWRLDPFVDDEGLLREGGRLKHSTLDSTL